MRTRTYFLLGFVLLLVLGGFLTLGIINSRKMMMELIKEEASAFLKTVASTQETSIFAEGKFEDMVVDELMNLSDLLAALGPDKDRIEKMRRDFNLNAIAVLDPKTGRILLSAGTLLNMTDEILKNDAAVFFDYFLIGHKKYMRFVYRRQMRLFYIEVTADDIETFRQQFGINKIINQIALNPLIRYLALQDRKGIIFATPGLRTISRIDDDSVLLDVIGTGTAAERIIKFDDENVLELVSPFVVEGETIGLFRAGVSLQNYYRHIRATERQLLLLSVILFSASFILVFFFLKYQSYINLKEVFSKTLSAVEDAVLMVDKSGQVVGANKMFYSMSRLEDRIILNHDYFGFFPGDPFSVAKVLKDGTKIVDEKSIFDRIVQYASYPLLDEKSRVTGSISVLRDVTRLREFEKEREESERLKFLGNLVANFAHEIKNPLNGLAIAAQRLAREFALEDKEYQRMINTMKREIESLNKTLMDFLSLARPRIREEDEFVLADLIREILILIEEQIGERHIKIRSGLDKEIRIIGNREDIKRAILNFLLNALDALSNIGDREGEIRVELGREGGNIVLRISDNGIGMDEDEVGKVFTPYFTTKKSGTGLGLYIAHNILRQYKVGISVKSEKGSGTTFTITLPQ